MDVGEGKASSFPFVLIKPLADREAEAAAASAEAAAQAEAAATDDVVETTPVAPATADFGLAASAILFAAACVTIGILRKKK